MSAPKLALPEGRRPIPRKTIQLGAALEVEKRSYTELVLHEPIGGQVKHAERWLKNGHSVADQRSYQFEIVAFAGNVPVELVRLLPARKMMEAAFWVQKLVNSHRPPDWEPDPDTPDQHTIYLAEPVTFEGREFGDLPLREPCGEEIQKAESYLRGRFGLQENRMAQFSMLSSVSGLPIEVVMKMPISVLVEGYDWLENFLLATPRTGET